MRFPASWRGLPRGAGGRALAMLAVVALAIAAYWPALGGDFVWDDDDNVSENPNLRGVAGLVRLWTNVRAQQQYYPLTHTTFWIERALFGDGPLAHHVTNLALHLLSGLLLYRLLVRARVPGAGLAAVVFALHPMNVESVAWITERKNVLSLALLLASSLAFVRTWGASPWWAAPASAGARGWEAPGRAEIRRSSGWLVAWFCLAVLAKSAVCVAPMAFLLADVAVHRRVRRTMGIVLAPAFALGIGAGLLTAWLEHNNVGATGPEFQWGAQKRLLVAVHAFFFYPAKLAWPSDLSFVYPAWSVDTPAPSLFVLPALTPVVAAALLFGRAPVVRAARLVVALYAVFILPALGIFDVYFMRYAYVQNHFAYHAAVPLIAGGAALVARLASAAGDRLAAAGATIRGVSRKALANAATAALACTLAAMCVPQAEDFADVETLYRNTLRKNPTAWLASYNLARRYHLAGRLDEALPLYEVALRAAPKHSPTHVNYGVAIAQAGRPAEGRRRIEAGLELDPRNEVGQLDYAIVLARLGEGKAAAGAFERALALKPDWTKAERLFAQHLATDEQALDPPRAVTYAERSCARTVKERARCLGTLATAYAAAARFVEADATLDAAVLAAKSEGNSGALRRLGALRESFAARRAPRAGAEGAAAVDTSDEASGPAER